MSFAEKDRPLGRARQWFSKEFKADAVALVLDADRPFADVARSLGIGETNLVNWIRQARIHRSDKPRWTTEERAGPLRCRGFPEDGAACLCLLCSGYSSC